MPVLTRLFDAGVPEAHVVDTPVLGLGILPDVRVVRRVTSFEAGP